MKRPRSLLVIVAVWSFMDVGGGFFRSSFGAGGCGDRLAPVGIGAVCGIEATGPFGELLQGLPSPLQPLEVLVEVAKMMFEELRDVVARRFAVTS